MSRSIGNLSALRAYIDATPALHAMSDADVAAALNGEQVPQLGSVQMNDVMLWVAQNGVRARLKDGMKQGGNIADLCENALELLTSPHVVSLTLGDPIVAAMLDTLAAVGVITTDSRDALLELAPLSDVTRAEVVFGRGVSSSDVAHARGVA